MSVCITCTFMVHGTLNFIRKRFTVQCQNFIYFIAKDLFYPTAVFTSVDRKQFFLSKLVCYACKLNKGH